jgi:hypothetical protein
MITVDQTVRAYTGRPGCMCGCMGKYKDSERSRRLAITQLLANPEVRLQVWDPIGSDPDAGCLWVSTPTRTRVLYLTGAGVEAARQLGVEEH